MSEQEQKGSTRVVEPGTQQQKQVLKIAKSLYIKYLLCVIPCCLIVMIIFMVIGFLVMRLW